MNALLYEIADMVSLGPEERAGAERALTPAIAADAKVKVRKVEIIVLKVRLFKLWVVLFFNYILQAFGVKSSSRMTSQRR
jgi:hypothetical protein